MTDKKKDIDAIPGERWFPKESTIIDDMPELWGDWGVCSEVDPVRKLRTSIIGPRALKPRSIRKNSELSTTTLPISTANTV